MEDHSLPRPGVHPAKEGVGEMKGGIDPVSVNPVPVEIPESLPEHHRAKRDTKKPQAGDIDLAEQCPGNNAYDLHLLAIVNYEVNEFIGSVEPVNEMRHRPFAN